MLIALLSELAGTVVAMAAMVMAMMWITITTDYPWHTKFGNLDLDYDSTKIATFDQKPNWQI